MELGELEGTSLTHLETTVLGTLNSELNFRIDFLFYDRLLLFHKSLFDEKPYFQSNKHKIQVQQFVNRLNPKYKKRW
jgi:hypothetical protein